MPYSVLLYTQYMVEKCTDARSAGTEKRGMKLKEQRVPLTEPPIEP